MRITADAIAGTLESSDLQVRVSPSERDTIEVAVTSSVAAQFGEAIRAVVDETLANLGLTAGVVILEDKGALDCTIRARVQAAVLRGAGQAEQTPEWSTL